MSNKKFYRYRLVDQDYVPSSRMAVEGYTLLKPTPGNDNWYVVQNPLEKLDKQIRTRSNIMGLVEYQEYDPITNQIFHTSTVEPPAQMYERNELFIKTRSELEIIAKGLDINPAMIKNEPLIRKILLEQRKYQTQEQKSKPEFSAN